MPTRLNSNNSIPFQIHFRFSCLLHLHHRCSQDFSHLCPSTLNSIHPAPTLDPVSSMHLPNLFAIFLLVAVGSASPRPQGGVPSCIDSPYRYGSSCAENGTLTSTSATLSTTTTSSATSTSTGPITAPTAPITVVAARSGSPIHFLRMNAAGLRFYLGQETLSYCPSEVDGVGACPPGNETVFSLCSMVS